MTINKYRAKTLKAAIDKARAELGLEAKVLHVKQLEGTSPNGGEIEILAAIDDDVDAKPSSLIPDVQPPTQSINHNNALLERKLKKAGASYTSHREMLHKEISGAASGISEKDISQADDIERSNFLNTQRAVQQKAEDYANSASTASREAGVSITRKQRTLRDNRRILQTLHECCSKNQVNDNITYEILSLLSDDEQPKPDERRSSFLIGRSSNPTTPEDYLSLFMKKQVNLSGGLDTSQRTTVLIGPTGVGKTTTLAKLAAQYHFQQRKAVGLISIDAYRIAAIDQLQTYAQIMSVPLKIALTPEELDRCIDEYGDMDLILIDTPGRSQFNTESLSTLGEFLEAAQPADTHLLIALSTKEDDAYTIAENFAPEYVRQVIFTKLDETSSFGSILNVSKMIGKPVSYFTTGQNVPDDIETAQVERIVDLFLNA